MKRGLHILLNPEWRSFRSISPVSARPPGMELATGLNRIVIGLEQGWL